ncbi:hypothetical protein SBA7_340028 [Candidatus Sulfotelmatobacter sp. SbA7]|nr:hypothetical protein SBA7_340028 [Candidatus Sulfotelmatobacter sp. SbA7]
MSKFGRFKFEAQEPAETYEGDYMTLDTRGLVRIFVGTLGALPNIGDKPPELVAAIHLDKSQSVRKMEPPISEPVPTGRGRKLKSVS